MLDSDCSIFNAISPNSAFFFSIKVVSFLSEYLKLLIESLRRINFVRSEILEPKFNDMEIAAGSKSSPESETAL